MSDAPKILKMFNISVRDEILSTIKNGGSDSFFIFSGPPQFSNLASGTISDSLLCPLLYTTNFTEPNRPTNASNVASMGSDRFVESVNTAIPMPGQISVGANALITGSPKDGADSENWNLLKKLYYSYILNPRFSTWLGEGGKMYGDMSKDRRVVAPEAKAIWGNFNIPPIYQVRIGILAIALTSSLDVLSVNYYEGVKIKDIGGFTMNAGVQQPTMYSGSTGFTGTFTENKTFKTADAKVLAGINPGEETFMEAVLDEYFS